jgi:hypothetical protein
MPCEKCMGYISDVIQHPPTPSSKYADCFNRKRIKVCLETITYLLIRHIEKSRPDMYEWLNVMEMMNCAILNQEASRDYRMFQVWTFDKSDIDEIITILMENMILNKSYNRYDYEECFAEKAMFILNTLPQIHTEHSGVRWVKIPGTRRRPHIYD